MYEEHKYKKTIWVSTGSMPSVKPTSGLLW